mgnify:FL=1
MTTALQIIERGYRTAGVLAAGETASADMAQDGLVYLNDVLNGLSNESLAIYTDVQDVLPLTGAVSYTYGEGGDIDSARPVTIISAFFRAVDGIDYPVQIVTLDQYNSIYDKTISTGIPVCMYVDTQYPLDVISLWPLASSGSLYINANKPLLNLSTYTTVLSLPVGYERLLRYCFAAEIMPEYGINNQQIIGMMMAAKGAIKRTNSKPIVLNVNLPFGDKTASSRRILSDGL